jgi:hypothetical protein
MFVQKRHIRRSLFDVLGVVVAEGGASFNKESCSVFQYLNKRKSKKEKTNTSKRSKFC